MIRIFLILPIILISVNLRNGQSNDWNYRKNIDGVKIYTQKQIADQNNQKMEYLVIKYENTNSKAVNINFKVDLWINENCRTCQLKSPNEYEYTLNLDKDETIQGKIKDNKKPFVFLSHKITPNSTNKTGITQIRFTNLSP